MEHAPHEQREPVFSTAATLCKACRSCLGDDIKKLDHETYEHHATFTDFVAAVLSECAFCGRLWRELDHDGSLLSKFSTSEVLQNKIITGERSAVYTKRRVATPAGIMRKYEQLQIVMDHFIVAQLVEQEEARNVSFAMSFVPADQISTRGDDPPSGRQPEAGVVNEFVPSDWVPAIHQAARWLHNCSSHPECTDSQPEQWMPRRLLDLSGCGSVEEVRVVDTTETPICATYFTLSHCWGRADFLRLETDNIEMLKSGFCVDALPPNFKHAIAICRAMHADYVWIDSLCILQDDIDDWAQQSMLMSDIYARAKCNIAADASADAHGGILSRAPPEVAKTIEIAINGKSYVSPGKYLIVDWYLWRELGSSEPLNQRAWVFQERLLARAIIHFSSNQLLWECRGAIASQEQPSGIPRVAVEDGNFKDLQILHDSKDPAQVGIGCERQGCGFCDRWERLVTIFTAKQLTFNDDRPMAMAGFVRMVGSKGRDKCILGMWLGHLMRQLCWRLIADQHEIKTIELRQSSSKRKFSSFSWYSVDGRIEFLPNGPEWYWYGVEAIIGPDQASRDAEGWTHMQYLIIEGHLLPVRLGFTEYKSTPLWTLTEPNTGMTSLLDGDASSQNKIVYVHPDHGRRNLPQPNDQRKFYLMPMAQTGVGCCWAQCMIIEMSAFKDSHTSATMGRRIGVCLFNWMEPEAQVLMKAFGFKFRVWGSKNERQPEDRIYIQREIEGERQKFALV